MKNHIVIAAVTASLLGSSAAMARPYDQHDDYHHMHNDHHDYDRHDNGHHWRRGDRVDSRYRSGRYVVSDYHSHHLNQPPRGYHWVHDDNNNFLLVAITTGVIASVILGAGR